MTSLSRRKLAQRATSRLLAGEDRQKVLTELAAYLLEAGRTKEADLIVRDIEMQLAEHGTVIGTVVSARKLSAESRRSVEGLAKAQYGPDSRVVLRERTDPSLIGGVRLELPGYQMDASVKAKLEKLTV